MSNTKHTPGPWKIGMSLSGKPTIYTEVDFKSVAWVDHDRSESDANAKLIAAAPELLEALDELRTAIIDCVDSEWWGRHKEAVAKAYEAIKKATE